MEDTLLSNEDYFVINMYTATAYNIHSNMLDKLVHLKISQNI